MHSLIEAYHWFAPLPMSHIINYIYTANGQKLEKRANGTRTRYSGAFIYEGNTLKQIQHSEGYVDMSGGAVYHYYLKDHLGNNRMVVNQSGAVVQQTDYYPFGMAFNKAGSADNKFLYNGKKLQEDMIGNGVLDWYDYGARMYDAAIGRWHSIDPLAEKYFEFGPYHYVRNNPINLIDPTGMSDEKPDDGCDAECQKRKKEAEKKQKEWDDWRRENLYKDAEYNALDEFDYQMRVRAIGGGGSREVASSQGGGWHPPMAIVALGYVDLGYNSTLDQFPNALNGFKYFGTGLSIVSTGLTGYGVYRQYQEEGLQSVDPFQFTSFTVGSTALLSKSLEWAGYRSMITSVIGRSAGIFGLGIASMEQWFNFYKSMDNLRFAPSYIDSNGNPYYGDPFTEAEIWGGY